MLRFHTLLVGLLGGHAMARWFDRGGPDADPLAWSVLSATFGVGVLAYGVAEILLDDGQG